MSDPILKHRPHSILPVHARPSETVVIHWHGPEGELTQTIRSPHLDQPELRFSRRPQSVESR